MGSFNLCIEYKSNDAYAPINELKSVHVIRDNNDIDVVCGFLDTFSEHVWSAPMLLKAVKDGAFNGEKETIKFTEQELCTEQ